MNAFTAGRNGVVPVQLRKHLVTYKCGQCGGGNVSRDADVSWDPLHQRWIVKAIYDTAECRDCDGETTLIEEAVVP